MKAIITQVQVAAGDLTETDVALIDNHWRHVYCVATTADEADGNEMRDLVDDLDGRHVVVRYSVDPHLHIGKRDGRACPVYWIGDPGGQATRGHLEYGVPAEFDDKLVIFNRLELITVQDRQERIIPNGACAATGD